MAVIQALELHDSSGTYVAAIQHFYAAHWIQAANACDELRFSVPTSELPEGFDFDQQIWLRRGDGADIARKFIVTEIQTHEGSQDRTDVVCYDYLSILGKLTVTDFPGEAYEDAAINARALVSMLLAAQSSLHLATQPVSETIDYSDINTSEGTILQVIQKIRQQVGGLLWVDNDYGLHFYATRYADHGFSLDLDRNLIDYTKSESRMGEDIQISYDLKAVDLSQISDADEGMLNIGMPVTLTPAGETLYITDIDQDLGNPLNLSLALGTSAELSGRRPDVVDVLSDALNNITDLDRRVDNIEAMDYDFDFEYGTLDDVTTIGADWSSEGVSDDLARIDHQHGVDYGEDIEPIGTVESAGTSDTPARSNHVHSLGTSIPYGTDVQPVGDANAAGTSTNLARVDHVHSGQALDFADASEIQPVGETAAAGTSDKVARADHVHVGASGSGTPGITFYLGKIDSLSADGNKIKVYLYDATAETWDTEITEIYKPYLLRLSAWSGKTITDENGRAITYSTAQSDSRYQRSASWQDDSGTVYEYQEITPNYITDNNEPEQIDIFTDGAGRMVDVNTGGRCWARIEEPEE